MSVPLEHYGLIGDGETAALVSRDGSIDWLCWPRFDSDACFAALSGPPGTRSLADRGRRAGHLARETLPDRHVDHGDRPRNGSRQRPADRLHADPGERDGVDPHRRRAQRHVPPAHGSTVAFRLRHDPALDRGDRSRVSSRRSARTGSTLHAPVPLEIQDHAAAAEFSVSAGQRLAFVLRHHNSSQPAPPPPDAEAALLRTRNFWREWIGRFDDRKTRWPREIRRSLITLKAMIHRPSGGLVASPTTSLPEAPGGTRNWDYRYCWLRNSTFTLGALINAGYHDEACRWRDWLVRTIGGSPANMRIMYRVDGGRHLNEWSVSGLPGYRYARPVRIGNAASTQRQIDVWGEVLDTLHLADEAGLPVSGQADVVRAALAEHLATIWDEPGSGLWESTRRAAALHVFASDGLGRDRSLRSLTAGMRRR